MKPKSSTWASAITAFLAVLTAGILVPAESATLRVPSEYSTIQNGIDAASAGDVVLVAPGTYPHYQTRNLPPSRALWTSCAFLKDGVIVRSEQGPTATEIDLSQISGPQKIAVIARLLPSTTTAFEGFRIRGPLALGFYAFFCGNVTIRDCEFSDFDGGPTAGGALLSNSNVTVIDSEFDNCKANTGGAIWHSRQHIVLNGCTFRNSGNVAVVLDEATIDDPILANVRNCVFLDNWSNTGGAGGLVVGVARGGTSTVSGCTFIENKNFGTGAGALGVSIGAKTIENNVFIDNYTDGLGGAIGGNTGAYSFLIRDNTFVGNAKVEDSSDGGTFGVGYCNCENNVVVGSKGGAVFQLNSYLETSCNVFWDNPRGVGYPLSPTDRILDPLFCDRDLRDYTLREGSPCLPEDPLGCGLIGAFGQGCGVISVDSKSWGAIKNYYRSKAR